MSRDWPAILLEHERVVAQLRDAGAVLDRIADTLVSAIAAGRRIYVFGNGGSAADAQHIAGELLGRFRRDRRALPVVALTTDTSTLTAVANDFSFERVFARQVEALIERHDVVWALSTSGDSPNVLAAVHAARERGAIAIGFTGASGGKLARLCDHVLCAPHRDSDRIQEAHLLAYHYVCERVEAAFA
ncbi:MAG: SIS domain-containing protein [Phycisphaerae bacterium]